MIAFGAPGDNTAASSAPEQRRGFKWAYGGAVHTVVHTILPPNGPTWAESDNTRRADMIATAGSRHSGGCHVLMGDGAVTFITDSIDTGNTSTPTVYVGAHNPLSLFRLMTEEAEGAMVSRSEVFRRALADRYGEGETAVTVRPPTGGQEQQAKEQDA